MPRLGLGLGIDKQRAMKSLTQELIDAGCVLALMADKPTPTKLLPRTLPNGVANGDYLQNVSADLVLDGTQSGYYLGTELTNTIKVGIPLTNPLATFTGDDLLNIQNSFFPQNNTWQDTENLWGYAPRELIFRINKSRLTEVSLVGVKAWLAQNPITVRYKLATPIDTLNTPVPTLWVDQAGKVGKNLFDQASARRDGYRIGDDGLEVVDAGSGYFTNFIDGITPNTQYTWQGAGKQRIYYYNGNTFISRTALNSATETFTTPANCNRIRLQYQVTTLVVSAWQLELGVVATAVEPYGKNNAMLVNVAGTSADGYTTQDIGGGVMKPFFKADGVDTYGVLANNPSVDITGLAEFGIGLVFKTSTITTSQWVIGKNLSTATDFQYGLLITSAGALDIQLEGTFFRMVETLSANTLYSLLVYRKTGRLKCRLSKVETYNELNSTSLTSKPNFGLFARSSSADGTTRALYSNVWSGATLLFNGAVKPFTEAQLIKAFDRAAKEYNL